MTMIITATRPRPDALFIVIVVKAFVKSVVLLRGFKRGAATWRSPDIALQKVFQHVKVPVAALRCFQTSPRQLQLTLLTIHQIRRE